MPDYRLISIGTLAAHPLWDEKAPSRTGHATTTLIEAGAIKLLVDPGLPAQAMLARLSERTSVRFDEITHVFLTSFQPERRRALRAFESAIWWIGELEKEAALDGLTEQRDEADAAGDHEIRGLAEAEIDQLQRCRIAPDNLAPKVDLFPLPGVTPGTCGLLLALPASTVLICGDAVATAEHLHQGKVLPHCTNLDQAMESFKEAVEIADVLVPGRDNLLFNPLRRMGS